MASIGCSSSSTNPPGSGGKSGAGGTLADGSWAQGGAGTGGSDTGGAGNGGSNIGGAGVGASGGIAGSTGGAGAEIGGGGTPTGGAAGASTGGTAATAATGGTGGTGGGCEPPCGTLEGCVDNVCKQLLYVACGSSCPSAFPNGVASFGNTSVCSCSGGLDTVCQSGTNAYTQSTACPQNSLVGYPISPCGSGFTYVCVPP